MIPCLVDRLLYKRMGNQLLSTLVYPASLITVQFLLSYVEQLGSVLNWTGFLFSMKPLIQMVSLTGVWGPSFLVGWMASTFNTVWEEGFDLRKARWPVALLAGTFVAVTLWGGIQLVFFMPGATGGTVKVGSVVVGLPEDNLFYTYLDLPEAAQIEQKEQYRQWSHQVQDELFATSETAHPQRDQDPDLAQRQRGRVRRRGGAVDRAPAGLCPGTPGLFLPQPASARRL